MKKYIIRIVGTLFVVGLVSYLTITILIATKLIAVGISPYAHYKLNENETRVIESSIADFRQKVESAKFDEIKAELAKNGRGERFQNDTIKKISETRGKFGKPESLEFFRCLPPSPVKKYYQNLDGNLYMLSYFTKTEKGEFSEHFDWLVNEDKATLMNYHADGIKDWETKNRESEVYIGANYANEIKIPFGTRFIEIRY